MYKNKSNRKKGYTVIETMIAISVFLVIVTIGMGSLLNANLIHNKSQDMRSIMDNLSFVMEDMSRSFRAGYEYYCISGGTTINDCSNGEGVTFKAYSGEDWAYVINSQGQIRKSTSGGVSGNFITMTSPEIVMNSNSGFTVSGSLPPPGDTRQPMITIRLVGSITSKEGILTPFSLQTSVSGRLIDVEY